MKNRPNKALTFFLSFCPGVGHLYLGAMTRGLQFMILFFGAWALIDFSSIGIFNFCIPIIWFYSLFDALQLADQEIIEDRPLVEWKHLTGHWLGPILIALGGILIIDDIMPRVWNKIFADINFSWTSFRSLAMALALIIIGMLLLRGKRVRKND
ncbi:MAG: hypothetical protein PHS56_02260 [Eubacteriales bacterium]|nr:hypothetical protein [Eubacteriales bacterium]MDD3073240.1 hypothetical protein [Eubacteriales bacterium]